MSIVCMVQARADSNRLPGKVLKLLGGKPVLWHVLNRCLAAPGISEVVCVTSDEPSEDPIVDIVADAGAKLFRGSKDDVAMRFLDASRAFPSEHIMRITGDCPFIDPALLGELAQDYLFGDYELAALAWWPRGQDAEIFPVALLEELIRSTDDVKDREHISRFIYAKPSVRRYFLRPGRVGFHLNKTYRWVLDYPEDLMFFEAAHTALGSLDPGVGWQDLLRCHLEDETLSEINRSCIANWASANKKAKTGVVAPPPPPANINRCFKDIAYYSATDMALLKQSEARSDLKVPPPEIFRDAHGQLVVGTPPNWDKK